MESSSDAESEDLPLPTWEEEKESDGITRDINISMNVDWSVNKMVFDKAHVILGDSEPIRPSLDVATNVQDRVINKLHVHVNAPVENMFLGETTVIKPSPLVEKPKASLSDERAKEGVEEFLSRVKEVFEYEAKERLHHFEQLQNPDEKVYPKMVVTNFFHGETAGPQQLKADPTYLTTASRKVKGEAISLEDIHKDCRYAALIADAGSGKTTTSKRYSKAASSKKISYLNDVEMVHFVPLAKLRGSKAEKGTFMELFFFNLLRKNISEEAKLYGSLWIKENSNKLLLVLDGLDQVDWGIKKCEKLQFDTKAHVSEVLYNILHESLLPNIKVLLTSREFAISKMARDTRPEKIIALDGLSEKDIRILIKELAPKKSDAIIEHMFKKSPALRSLSTNPMFLIFTTAILAKDSEDAPDNLSGVLMRLLFYFISSENQRVENIRDILENLCGLALEGMENLSLSFTEDDMERHGLNPKLAQDLVIITPEEGTENHYKLMEGCFLLFFCHQSVQEALAAVQVSKKSDDGFHLFVWNQLHKPHLEVVLRILVGIIFNSRTLRDAKRLTKGLIGGEKKKAILTEWLVKVINKNQESCGKKEAKRMKFSDPVPVFKIEDLCSLLYECGDSIHDMIYRHIHSIIIKKRIRLDQMHAVAWVMSHCHPGIDVELESGSATSSLDLLAKGLRQCNTAKVKLSNLHMSINNQVPMGQPSGILTNSIGEIILNVKQSDQEPFRLLSGVVDQAVTEKLCIFPEKLKENALVTKEQLSELKKIDSGMISKLNFCRKDLAAMSNTSADVFFSIGELVKQFQVKDVSFRNLCLNKTEKEELENGANGHKFEVKYGRLQDLG